METDKFSLSDALSSTERERKESQVSCVLVDGSASIVGRTVARPIALMRAGGAQQGLEVRAVMTVRMAFVIYQLQAKFELWMRI